MKQMVFQSTFLTSALFLVAFAPSVKSMPLECNGLENLCNVQVTQSCVAMVHNAMAAVDNGFAFAANHIDDPIVESLTAGYRGLSLDICNCNGNLEFCHGNDIIGCGVGSVDPIQAFTEINDWIVENPNNIIMISLQINEDAGGPISLEMIQELVQQVPNGFSDRLYDHWPVTDEWPTLGQLIEANQQVLFFYFKGPEGSGDHISGLNYWYDYVWATDWQWESTSELQSTLLDNCPITRGTSTGTGDFLVIEAYVTETALFGLQFQPSRDAAQQINTVEWAGSILDACFDIHGIPGMIVMVDFWSEGNLPALMQQRNALLVGSPTTSTTPSPTLPIIEDEDPPTNAPTTSTDSNIFVIPTASPTQSPSLLPTSNATTSDLSLNGTVCTLETNEGELVMIPDGESYGDYITTRCGSSDDFPCFCNMGQIQCPYCAFVAQGTTLYCARHDETIEFVDGSVYKSCSCEIPDNPLEDPISSCQEIPFASTKSFVPTIDPNIDIMRSDVDALESISSSGGAGSFASTHVLVQFFVMCVVSLATCVV